MNEVEMMIALVQKRLRRIIFPVSLNVLFFINAALPRTVLGCVNRGLVAIAITFLSFLLAFVSVIMALKTRRSNQAESTWWILNTLIYAIPAVALLYLA
jgi:hypothetical protein